jgi:hypothetical protein
MVILGDTNRIAAPAKTIDQRATKLVVGHVCVGELSKIEERLKEGREKESDLLLWL